MDESYSAAGTPKESNVSGESITIVAADDSDVVRFVDAIARLPTDLPEWVLIGGVAVLLRVGGTHRATVDIDALARESNRLVELLVNVGGQQRAAHKLIVPVATQLDVMAVGSVPDPSTCSRWRASSRSSLRRPNRSRYCTSEIGDPSGVVGEEVKILSRPFDQVEREQGGSANKHETLGFA